MNQFISYSKADQFFFRWNYEHMVLHIFDGFKSLAIVIIIEAQIVLFSAGGRLLKLTLESLA